jgi:hypothetical protein
MRLFSDACLTGCLLIDFSYPYLPELILLYKPFIEDPDDQARNEQDWSTCLCSSGLQYDHRQDSKEKQCKNVNWE